jgi:tetratricopeptide (TPR) repeat protein
MRPLVSIAVSIGALLVGSANPLWAADKWVSIRSQNFVLVGDAPEARIKAVGRDLEQFRAAFAMLFPNAGRESTVTTTVFVFKDAAAFSPYKPLYQGKPANIAAYYLPGTDGSFIALNGDIETPTVIYHEFVHSLISDATARLPLWANEGMAEFYSTFRTSGATVDLGYPLNHHVAFLERKSFIPLDALLAVDHGSPYYNEGVKQGVFYAESWALVHYLIAGKDGIRRPQLTRYLTLVASGRPIDESFQEAFQTDYHGIEKELREYLQQVAFTFFRLQLPTKLDFDKSMQSASLSDAQVAAYLGDLLVHMGRDDAAATHLQRAIELDPKLSSSYASMGLLHLRKKEYKQALEYLTKALDAESPGYMTHFYYAQVLASQSEDVTADQRRARLELMRTHLKKAIALSPHFALAYGLLGYVSLMLKEDLETTEAALLTAVKFAPGREDLQLMFADVLAAGGKDAAARAVVAALRAGTTSEATRHAADTRLAALQARIAAAQALRDDEARRKTSGLQESANGAATPQQGSSAGSTPEPTKPSSSSGTPEPVRATPSVAGLRVEGELTMIDCDKGVTLNLRTDKGMAQLHTDTPEKIQFISYIASLQGPISCGRVDPERHVVVAYRRSGVPGWLGEPILVEFRAKE